MSMLTVIGVDPGTTTGIATLHYNNENAETPELIQCTPGAVNWIVLAIVDDWRTAAQPDDTLVLAVEKFVVSGRSARLSAPRAAGLTRHLIALLAELVKRHADHIALRSASEVKPWATDARLAAMGATGRGMPHAKDAARHALFAAVRDCGMPDPLSAKTRGS